MKEEESPSRSGHNPAPIKSSSRVAKNEAQSLTLTQSLHKVDSPATRLDRISALYQVIGRTTVAIVGQDNLKY